MNIYLLFVQKTSTFTTVYVKNVYIGYIKEVLMSYADKSNKITIKNSTVGVINTGKVLGKIESSIGNIGDSSQELKAKDALTSVLDFLKKNQNEISSEAYNEALEYISDLSQQASLNQDERSSPSLIRMLINSLAPLVQGIAAGTILWKNISPSLSEYFGV